MPADTSRANESGHLDLLTRLLFFVSWKLLTGRTGRVRHTPVLFGRRSHCNHAENAPPAAGRSISKSSIDK